MNSFHIPNIEIAGIYYEDSKIPVGSKVKFAEEKQAYTVQASNVAFTILTKPFNARKTVLYTIIDWKYNIRGTENLVFGFGAESKQDCEEMLERLTQGESQVSSRNNIPLNIEKYKLANTELNKGEVED